MKYLLFLIPLFLLSCNSVSDNSFSPEEVQKDAEQFLEALANDFLQSNRDAIVDRYDPGGAYMVGSGIKMFNDLEKIQELYAEGNWNGPEEFSWEDLSYEVISSDAIVVAGFYNWKWPNRSPFKMSFTSLLLKQDGEWKIRLEDQSVNPIVYVTSSLEVEGSLYQSLIEKSVDPAVVKEAFEAIKQ